MYGYIYKITNLINSKIYIGKAKNIDERFKRHIRESLKYNTDSYVLHSAIRKYGAENFIIEEIDNANSLEELNTKEIYWIEYYNSTKKEIGYNRAPGGDGGDIFHCLSEEKQNEIKIKSAHGSNSGRKHWNNGEVVLYTFEKPYGDNWVEGDLPEHCQKRSKSLKGKKAWNKGITYGPEYDETRKKIGESSKKRCKTNHPTAGKKAYNNGEKFIYLNPGEPVPEGFIPGKGNLVKTYTPKKVKCITTGIIYDSAKIAAKKLVTLLI